LYITASAGVVHRLSLPISDLRVEPPPAPVIVAPRPDDGLRRAVSLPSLLPSQENPPSDLSVGPSSVRSRYRRDRRSFFDRRRRSLLRLIADLRWRFQLFSRDCFFSRLFTPDVYDPIYAVIGPLADGFDEISISASETSTLPDFPSWLEPRDN
jgi:hypothetical protein